MEIERSTGESIDEARFSSYFLSFFAQQWEEGIVIFMRFVSMRILRASQNEKVSRWSKEFKMGFK